MNRRGTLLCLALAVAMMLPAALATAEPRELSDHRDDPVRRVAGDDRILTAVEIARAVHDQADVATSRPATPERTAGYQLLAEILIDGLASAPATTDPSPWAHQVGERWGPRLIDRLGFRGTGTPSQVMHTSFEAMGFAPETTPDQVRLHACPFADLAMGHIVCDLHLGMARGMLADLDADVTADELTPFVGPSLCVLALTEQ